jgi:hypothetical protein
MVIHNKWKGIYMINTGLSKVLEKHYNETSTLDRLELQTTSNKTIAKIRERDLNKSTRAKKEISLYKWAIPISVAALSITLYYFGNIFNSKSG